MENIMIKLSIVVSIALVYIGWIIWELIHAPIIDDEFEMEHKEAVDYRDNTENPEKN